MKKRENTKATDNNTADSARAGRGFEGYGEAGTFMESFVRLPLLDVVKFVNYSTNCHAIFITGDPESVRESKQQKRL